MILGVNKSSRDYMILNGRICTVPPRFLGEAFYSIVRSLSLIGLSPDKPKLDITSNKYMKIVFNLFIENLTPTTIN